MRAYAPLQAPQIQETVQSLTPKQIALREANKAGLNVDRFLAVIDCESGFRADAIGDGGRSYGVAQLFLPAHPEITKEQALDPEWSLAWMANEWKKGHASAWSCWRQLYG